MTGQSGCLCGHPHANHKPLPDKVAWTCSGESGTCACDVYEPPTPSASDLRRQQEAELRATLSAYSLDGPFQFPVGGDFLSMVFGAGPRSSYAICLRCGVPVVLGDPEELVSGMQTERGLRIHTAWHEAMEAGR